MERRDTVNVLLDSVILARASLMLRIAPEIAVVKCAHYGRY